MRRIMMPFVLLFILLLAFFGMPACGGENANGDGGNGEDGNGGQDGNDGQDGSGGESGPKPDAPICDEYAIEAGSIPPNLLLVVDRSGSMREKTVEGGATTKIQDAIGALNYLLDEGDGKIRFGWMQFPRNSSCAPGIVDVDCADDSVPAIRARVNALTPNGGTPTGESLQNANSYQGLHDESRSNFAVLITDGMPSCPNGGGTPPNEADNQLALQAIRDLHTGGVDTFVIGLGENLNDSNPTLMNEMAVEGGRPRAGADKYYKANSLDELRIALEEIGGMVIGCNLSLATEPPDPDFLWVYFDGVDQPRDRNHINGWDYDPDRNQINFYGPACDQLRSGLVNKVDVKMGCERPN